MNIADLTNVAMGLDSFERVVDLGAAAFTFATPAGETEVKLDGSRAVVTGDTAWEFEAELLRLYPNTKTTVVAKP